MMTERNLFYEQLEAESSGDYVYVVRCKDCIEWDRDWKPFGQNKNERFCPVIDMVTEADFFCKYGECKDGGVNDV